MVLRPTVFDPNVVILHITGLSQAALEIEENPPPIFSSDETPRKPITGIAVCCARTARPAITAVSAASHDASSGSYLEGFESNPASIARPGRRPKRLDAAGRVYDLLVERKRNTECPATHAR
jgi:hypothetical protein